MSSACSFIFMQIKKIFIRMVSRLHSLSNRGIRELGNGMFASTKRKFSKQVEHLEREFKISNRIYGMENELTICNRSFLNCGLPLNSKWVLHLSCRNEFDLQDKRARRTHCHVKVCSRRLVLKLRWHQLGNGLFLISSSRHQVELVLGSLGISGVVKYIY